MAHLNRRDFLYAAGAASAGICSRANAALFSRTSERKRPNLLVIYTDEHNIRTLGCYRETMTAEDGFIWGPDANVDTPHLDRLAHEGALATHCYATTPVCTPSRAAFMTGRYPQNTGAPANHMPMDDDMITFAQVLQAQGYATGYAGKWHLDGEARPGWAPERQFGFADNRYMINRGHWKKLEDTPDGPRVAARDADGNPVTWLQDADEESFTTDFLTTKAIDFIDAHRDAPFCYVLSIPDPHTPNTVRPPYDTMFDPARVSKPPSAFKTPEQTPRWGPPNLEERGRDYIPYMTQYFGMVKCIDDNVGRILKKLEELNLMDDTIIVFKSDHGELAGEHGRYDKGVPFEASARVPFIVRYPKRIPAGTRVESALGMVDVMPTLLSLMDVAIPDTVEGRDVSPRFIDGAVPGEDEDITFLRALPLGPQRDVHRWLGAATSRYKLIVSPLDTPWFFDLVNDPHELNNLFHHSEHRDRIRRFAAALLEYGARYGDSSIHDPVIRADLEWCARGDGTYTPVPRS